MSTAKLMLGLLLLVALTGCHASRGSAPSTRPHDTAAFRPVPEIGQPCTIHLRRDALGMAGVVPLGAGSQSPAGTAVVLHGIFRGATEEWVALSTGGKICWIPRSVILMLEMPERQ